MPQNNPFRVSPIRGLAQQWEAENAALPDFSQISVPSQQFDSGSLTPPPDLAPVFEQASMEHNVPVNVLMAIGHQESRYRPDAVGVETQYGRAKGLMQYIDDTARGVGIDPFDPVQSINAAARQYAERIARGYTHEEAIMAHHGGDDRRQWGPKTRAYVQEVMQKAGIIGESLMGQPASPVRDGLPDQGDLAFDPNSDDRYALTPEDIRSIHERGYDANVARDLDAIDRADARGETPMTVRPTNEEPLSRWDQMTQDITDMVTGGDGQIPYGSTVEGIIENDMPKPLADFTKQFVGGAYKGIGATVRGVGAIPKIIGDYTTTPLINKLLGTEHITRNMLEVPADMLNKYGDWIQEGVSEATKRAIKESTPDGDLFDPSTWTFGENPSVLGYLALGSDVVGQMLPIIAATVATGGQSTLVQTGVSALAGGAQGGGAAIEEVREIIDEMATTFVGEEGGLTVLEKESPYYRELIASGKTPEQALEIVKDASERLAYLMTFPVSGAGGIATNRILHPATKILSRQHIAARIAGRVILGGSEEGTQETLESIQTRRGINLAAGTNLNVTEGTFGDFILGTIAGGKTGAGGALLSRREEAEPSAPTPKGPLGRSVNDAMDRAAQTGPIIPGIDTGPMADPVAPSSPSVIARTPEGDIAGVVESVGPDGTTRFIDDEGMIYEFGPTDGVEIIEQADVAPETPSREVIDGVEYDVYRDGLGDEVRVPAETAQDADTARPEGYQYRSDGTPFGTEATARRAIQNRRLEGYEPVEVDGGWAIAPVSDQVDRKTTPIVTNETGETIPTEYAGLFDDQGRTLFPNAQSVREFRQRTGIGHDGLRAIQQSVIDGNPISLEEARAVDEEARQRRAENLEEQRRKADEENKEIENKKSEPVTRKVVGTYEVPGIDGYVQRLRVVESSDGTIDVIGITEDTAHNDITGLVNTGKSIEESLAMLYGDHAQDAAPDVSKVKKIDESTQAASDMDELSGAVTGQTFSPDSAQTAPEQAQQEQPQQAAKKADRPGSELSITESAMGKVYATAGGARIAVMEGAEFAPRANSITEFVVPEEQRGKGVGADLLRRVLAYYDKNDVSAAASSEASVRAFYREGFRPITEPDASVDRSIEIMRADSSVTMVVPREGQRSSPSGRTAEQATDQDTSDDAIRVFRGDGTPFRTESTARQAARNRRLTGYEPVQVEGGWALEPVADQMAGIDESPADADVQPEDQTTAQDRRDEPVQYESEGLQVVEVPVADLKLSDDVPQFKQGADARGVVEPLEGEFDRRGLAPLQVWRRLNGDLEVISGRHRLDLAQRTGQETVPVQIHDEADGFTAQQASVLDAELNIRDGQGTVSDYADFFRSFKYTREEAQEKGLLARVRGKRGYAIAATGSEPLIASLRAGRIADTDAEKIAQAAPNNERLQSVGLDQIINHDASVNNAINTMRAVQSMGTGTEAETMDMFGFDDSAIREAVEMARVATRKQREISERLSAITGAARRPEVARREGVDVRDPEAIKRRIEELRAERDSWDRWNTDPEKVAEIREELGLTERAAPSPIDETLAARHAELDPRIDALSDDQAERAARHIGISESEINRRGAHEALKQQHPDDIEDALGLVAPQADPSQDGLFGDQAETPAAEQTGDFQLAGQTEQEIIEAEEREAQRQREEAERERQAEMRERADRERDDFVLTGSDRPADELAARGQQDIFQQPDQDGEGTERFSVSGPRNLYVAHNLSAENILAANELGGLAAPSLAIARTDRGFDNFGEVTLLADPSMLDDRSIRTFDADIYSPRQPRAHYDIDERQFYEFTQGLDPDNLGLDKPDINEASGEGGARALLNSDAVRLKFLEEKGRVPRLYNEKVDPAIRRAANLEGAINDSNPDLVRLAEQYYRGQVRRANEADAARGEQYESLFFNEDGTLQQSVLRDFVRRVRDHQRTGGKDISRFRSDLHKRFHNKRLANEYEQWVTDTFNSMVKGRRLYKGFTPSGNRRYVPYTMENVLREMTKKLQAGENWFYGAGSVRSAYANELRTLRDIQARRDQIISEADFETIRDESNNVFTDALDKLKPFYKYDADSWNYMEDAGSAIAEGRRGIREAFNVTPEAQKIIDDLVDYLRNLPTTYFEAKAQRAVQFSEFNTAVVPKGMRRDALQVLRDAGLRIKTYDPKVEGDRARVIADQERLLFRIQDQEERQSSLTVDSLRQVLERSEFGPIIQALIDNGSLKLHNRISDVLPGAPAGAQAFADTRTGVLHLGAQGLDASNAASVLLHEAFHGLVRPFIGTEQWIALQRRLGALYRQAQRSEGRMNEFWREAVSRVDNARRMGDRMTEAVAIEEFGAYAIENYDTAPRTIKKWVDDLVGAVKAWMIERFGVQLGNVTPAQLRALTAAALRARSQAQVTRGSGSEVGGSAVGGAPLSLGNTINVDGVKRPTTNSEGRPIAGTEEAVRNFWNWFGDSKVVDADGKPMVMYHGTDANFTEFSDYKPNFFSGSANYASAYGESVIPVFLRIETPFDTASDSEARRIYNDEFRSDSLGRDAPALKEGQSIPFTWADEFFGFIYEREFTAKKRTYDGIVVAEKAGGNFGAEGEFAFVPLENTQIKSATGNQGTFDPANPDIRFDVAPPTNTRAFRDWFRDSAVVDDNGDPMVVYHGTTSNIDAFRHSALGVNTGAQSAMGGFFFTNDPLNAQEYAGGDVSRRGAITPQEIMAGWPEEDRAAYQAAIDHRDSLKPKGTKYDDWMLTDEYRERNRAASELFEELLSKNSAGPNIMPVYLSLQRPLEYDMQGRQYRDVSYTDLIKEAKRKRRDGVIIRNTYDPEFGDVYIAFRPEQIKSAIGNVGTFDPTNPDIRYSVRASEHFDDLNDKQKEFLDNIGPERLPQRLSDHWNNLKDNLALRVRKAGVDRYAALLRNDEAIYGEDTLDGSIASSSWVLARMSSAAGGALSAMLDGGRIYLDTKEKVIDVRENTTGLRDVFLQLGSPQEVERFMGWIAANRAKRLMDEGRENLFTPEQIEAGIGLATGKTEEGKSRAAMYRKAWREFQQYRDDVLKIAEQTGIISPEQRQTWREEFYVPFYRVLDDDTIGGPSFSSGLTKQQAYKRLKGGRQKLNDLLENTMMNFHHLLQASLKNQAAQQAIDNAIELDIARPVTESTRDKKRSTWVMRNGQKHWYDIDDALTFKAINALSSTYLNNPIMKAGRAFKRLYTNMITVTPQFIARNTFRDTVQAMATSPTSMVPFQTAIQGVMVYGDSYNRARMLASGGAFSFGHVYGQATEEIQRSLRRTMRRGQVLSDTKLIPGTLMKAWRQYEKVVDASENINRAGIWARNVETKGKLYAAFEARDLVDFSSHGDNIIVRILIDLVPFLNARIQGLDKLYRAGIKSGGRVATGRGTRADQKAFARFAIVTGALAMLSMMLYLRNYDDEEYRKLEDWQRDTYWFIRFGDNAFFIPKPFEVGAIATLAERSLEQFVDPSVGGRKFGERLWAMLTDTFEFDIRPQAIRPMIEVSKDRDSFTGRPIEGPYMDRLSPSLRTRPSTTRLAEAASRGMEATLGVFGAEDSALSPLQIDHLIRGYLGQVGTSAVATMDVLWRRAMGEELPARRWNEYQPIRWFYRDLGAPAPYTRYMTDFYEALKESDRAYADVQQHKKNMEYERAESVERKKQDELGRRKYLNRTNNRIRKINADMRKIQIDKSMSAEEKRNRLDRLRELRNMLAEDVIKMMEREKIRNDARKDSR